MQSPTKLFNRNFLLQWQGQSVSRLGSQVFSAAMVFWIKRATGSASLMGLMSLVSGLPAVLLTPIGGAVADRYSRRKIIIVSDLIRGVALLGLTGLIFWRPEATGAILVGIFLIAILNGVIGSFFGPAIAATIPDLVPQDKVTAANSMGQLSIQASVFLGQGLGGVLFRVLGAPILFFINALSFLYSSASEIFVTVPQTIPERKGSVRQQFRAFGTDIVEGLRFVWARPGLRELVLLSAIISFFTAPVVILLPFYIEDTLLARPDWYGFILAAFGVGTMLGYLFAGVTNFTARQRPRAIILFIFLSTIGYGVLGLVRVPVQALGLAVLDGFASGFVTVNITTLVQVTTPSEIRGRVVGLLAAISTALTPIAMGIAGVVADLLNQNIPLIYVACGAITLVASIILSLNPAFRSILAFEMPRKPDAPDSAANKPQAK